MANPGNTVVSNGAQRPGKSSIVAEVQERRRAAPIGSELSAARRPGTDVFHPTRPARSVKGEQTVWSSGALTHG